MPVDARGLSAHVLVDGRAVPELADPDTTPRDWAFLRTAATNGQVSPEAAAACAQSKCLVATTAGTRFEVVVVNATRHHLCVDTFVDGRKIDSLSLFGEHAARDEQTGPYGPGERYMWTARIEGDYVGATTASIATNAVRPMRFAQLRQVEEGGPATRDFGAASQAGRIDVVARVIENLGDKKLMAAAPGSARGEDAQATGATKKDIFGLGTSYGDAIATAANSSEYGAMRTPRVSRDCFATFSFRYAAIEALHIAKTTPKAWLDRETALTAAAKHGEAGCVKLLLAAGADAERRGRFSRTPLICAAECGSVACVEQLLEAGAAVGTHLNNNGETAHKDGLHSAETGNLMTCSLPVSYTHLTLPTILLV